MHNRRKKHLFPLERASQLAHQAAPAQSLAQPTPAHTQQCPMEELFIAVKKADVAEVMVAISRNPRCVFDKDANGFTALHYAATNGSTQIVVQLLSHGASPRALHPTKGSPLHCAAIRAHFQAVQQLCKHPEVSCCCCLRLDIHQRDDVFADIAGDRAPCEREPGDGAALRGGNTESAGR